MAAGLVLILLGAFVFLRTVVPDQPNGNLVDLILGKDD
jgi:hypothetical protein